MITKYVNNNNSLARTNQIDIRRTNSKPKRSSASRMLLIIAVSFMFAFLLISLSSNSVSSNSVVAVPGTDSGGQEEYVFNTQKLNSTKDSGRVILERNIATATGAALILEDTPQGKLLGRRGAVTDARRNLLVLRQKLLKDPNFNEKNSKTNNISGVIAGTVIHSERIKDNVYILQVDIPLSKLMEGDIKIEIEQN